MKKIMKPGTVIALVAALFLSVLATSAFAQADFNGLVNNIKGQATGLKVALALFCWAVAGFLFIQTFMKLKGFSSNPQDPNNKISTMVITGVVAVFLAVLPDVIGIGIGSFFGDNANVVGAGTGFSLGDGTTTPSTPSTPSDT